jgi:hypothetical protein
MPQDRPPAHAIYVIHEWAGPSQRRYGPRVCRSGHHVRAPGCLLQFTSGLKPFRPLGPLDARSPCSSSASFAGVSQGALSLVGVALQVKACRLGA